MFSLVLVNWYVYACFSNKILDRIIFNIHTKFTSSVAEAVQTSSASSVQMGRFENKLPFDLLVAPYFLDFV